MRIKRFLGVALALMGGVASYAQTSPYTGTTVKEGEFYLYNVESGLWLQNNDSKTHDWHTRANVGTRGLDFTLNPKDDGFLLNAKFGQPSINPGNNYLDNGGDFVWVFTPVEKEGVSNAYTIKNGIHVMGTVRYNENFKANNLFTQTGDLRWYLENPPYNENMTERNTWQVVTKEERLAKLAEATEENPLDASWLIPSADFPNNDTRYNKWIKQNDGGNIARGGDADGNLGRGSMIIESFNSTTMHFYTTIEVPNGKYKMTLQGFYRDGTWEEVEQKRADGTETIRAYYYANDVKHNLKSILDDAPSAAEGNYFVKTKLGNYYFPDAMDQAQRCMNLVSAYVNEEIEVTVLDGRLTIGVRKDSNVAGDWVIFDNFKLTYYGPVTIDISEYTEALDKAIADAEAFTGNTTDVLQANLDKAIAEAKAVRESTDTDVLVEKTAALKDALSAATAVDDTMLEKTIAAADAQGGEIAFLANAKDFVANGTDAGVLNELLAKLRIARKVAAQESHFYDFVSAEPADGESFYLYNVGQGKFFCGGAKWGAHAALGWPGIEVTLTKQDTERGTRYIVDTHLNNGGALQYLNWSNYCDTADKCQWLFEKQENGNYLIRAWDPEYVMGFFPYTMLEGNYYFGHVNNYRDQDLNNLDLQWRLVTKEQRDALLEKAENEAPIDASHLVKMPNFSQREFVVSGSDNWNKTDETGAWNTNGSIWNRGGDREDFALEGFNNTNFNLEQTITGLKPGKYQVTLQGFYRDRSHENFYPYVNDGNTPAALAHLYINGVENATLPSILDGKDAAPGLGSATVLGEYPNDPGQATQFFNVGKYKVASTPITVGEDGKLTIAVKKVGGEGGDWVVVDNFRLVCLSLDLTLADTEDNQAALATNDGKDKTVKVNRSFVADTWNTVVVPFDMDAAAITENFGAGTKVAKLDNEDGEGVLHFVTTTTIEAGVPYLIKPATAATAVKATGTVKAAQANAAGETYDFVGIYAPTAPAADDYFVAADNKLKKNTANTALKAFRGYFKAKAGAKALTGFDIDGETTGIITIDGEVVTGKVYNVNGQQMNAQSLQKGIYIVNGKKVVK